MPTAYTRRGLRCARFDDFAHASDLLAPPRTDEGRQANVFLFGKFQDFRGFWFQPFQQFRRSCLFSHSGTFHNAAQRAVGLDVHHPLAPPLAVYEAWRDVRSAGRAGAVGTAWSLIRWAPKTTPCDGVHLQVRLPATLVPEISNVRRKVSIFGEICQRLWVPKSAKVSPLWRPTKQRPTVQSRFHHNKDPVFRQH